MSLIRYFSLMSLVLLLSGCLSVSESDKARDATRNFWQAVVENNMEQAKQIATWDSTDYLKFIRSQQFEPRRFEIGELKIDEYTAEVATMVYTGAQGDVSVPVRTILVRYEDEWRVDVQKTMGSMVSGAMGAVVNQLNGFLQDGLRGLDDALNQSIDQLGKGLEQGLQDLQKELETIRPPSDSNPNKGQAI